MHWIGSRITKKDVKELKTVLSSAVILIITIVILSPGIGIVINRISNLDITTAVFASAPGGMTDMALIADELGADASKVLLLQLVRIIIVINLFPIILAS